MSLRAWLGRLAVALCALPMLSSCGGGGAVAGIEGTGTAQVAAASSGPISRFGSIFVNGVEFDTTHASISIDGQSSTASQLSVGDVVEVQGSIASGGTTGTATTVDYRTVVQGPISSVDAAGSSVTVLGQTVQIGPQTSLGTEAGGTPSFASLVPGTLVEVSGFPAASGAVAATRVEIQTQLSAYELTGVVSAVDPSTLQVVVSGDAVDFSGAQFAGFPAGAGLQVGDRIQVEIPVGPLAGTLLATRITLLPALSAASGAQGAVQGEVDGYVSSTQFQVDDTPISTDAQTQYQNGTAANLASGVEISVQGSFDASGTLVAAMVQFAQTNPILVRANVTAVDPTAGTLTVLGIAVSTDALTRYEDQTSNPVTPFNLSVVAVGDYVEIHGHLSASGVLQASVLTREDPGTEVELRAPPSAAVAPSLTVLGVAALTNSTTQYQGSDESSISSAQFFAAAAGGATVDLTGTISAGTLQVTTATLPGEAELGD
jgi:hypothetical protein